MAKYPEGTKFVRVRSYYPPPNSKWTGAEFIMFGDNHAEAITRFRKSYPEHDACTVVAETIDAAENQEYIAACERCGCTL